jgi:hypothetical protein
VVEGLKDGGLSSELAPEDEVLGQVFSEELDGHVGVALEIEGFLDIGHAAAANESLYVVPFEQCLSQQRVHHVLPIIVWCAHTSDMVGQGSGPGLSYRVVDTTNNLATASGNLRDHRDQQGS